MSCRIHKVLEACGGGWKEHRVDPEDTKVLQLQEPLSNCRTHCGSRNLQLGTEIGQELLCVAGRILTPQQCSYPGVCSELGRNLRSVGISSLGFRHKPFQKWLRDGVSTFGKPVWLVVQCSPGSVALGQPEGGAV